MTPSESEIWSVQRLLDWTTQYLADKRINNPRLNVEWLLSDILQCKRLDLYVDYDRPLSTAELDAFKLKLKRRMNDEPLQYIVGSADFMGLTFEVNPSVLIPRPDTELLVEKTLESCAGAQQVRIIDIGTGSGVVAISLAHWLQKRKIKTEITGLDISEAAIRVAEHNARTLLKDSSVSWVVADVFDMDDSFDARFDMVVSNPPYVSDEEFEMLAPEVKNHEPSLALRAADNGLIFYQHISNLSRRLFDPASPIRECLFEMGYNQAESVQEILHSAGFDPIRVFRDYGGNLRVVKAHYKN